MCTRGVDIATKLGAETLGNRHGRKDAHLSAFQRLKLSMGDSKKVVEVLPAQTHARARTHTHKHTHTRTQTRTHSHLRARARANAHTSPLSFRGTC